MHCWRAVAFPLALCTLALAPPRALGVVGNCDNFRRGDLNSDGRVEIGDAVRTLMALFAGGERIYCDDAADANDSGTVDVSDAIYTLNFLFLGGPPLPAPGSDTCGPDPTADALRCLRHMCSAPPTVIDESAFTRFSYKQVPALGFCPDFDKVFGAIIEKEADGSYRLEHSILEERPGDPGCLRGLPRDACWVPVSQPSRLLTPAEAERVRSLFDSIWVHATADTICQCEGIDPCRIGWFTWDHRSSSDFLCQAPYIVNAQAIRQLLESLRTTP